MKYQPKGRPRGSSSDDGKDFIVEQFIFSAATSAAAAATTTTTMNNNNNKRAVSIVIAFLHLCIRVNKVSQPCCEWLHISKLRSSNK